MPKAVTWYRVYCLASAIMNGALALASLGAILGRDRLASEAVPVWVFVLAGAMFLPVGLVFGAVALWLPTIPPDRRAWALHLTNIVLGVGSVCLTPLCLPLLVAWLKPDVQAYFGRGPATPSS